MNFQQDYNKLPPHAEIEWAGWRANVVHLAHSGWEMESYQDYMNHAVKYLFRHRELKLRGMSNPIHISQWHQFFEHNSMHEPAEYSITVEIAGQIYIEERGRGRYRGIIPRPIEFAQYNGRELIPLDYLFPDRNPPPEIIVEKRPEVIDLLNQIKDIQSPRAKELLAQERKKGQVHSFETAANIIAIR